MTCLPSHFKETDPSTLYALVRGYPLATWVVPIQGERLLNHIPFLLDEASAGAARRGGRFDRARL